MNSKTLIRILAVGAFLLLIVVAKPFVIVRAGAGEGKLFSERRGDSVDETVRHGAGMSA